MRGFVIQQHHKVAMLNDKRFRLLLATENKSDPSILLSHCQIILLTLLFFCLAQNSLEYLTMLYKNYLLAFNVTPSIIKRTQNFQWRSVLSCRLAIPNKPNHFSLEYSKICNKGQVHQLNGSFTRESDCALVSAFLLKEK
jgi:hypothetical protein